jgi:hypothetical protein
VIKRIKNCGPKAGGGNYSVDVINLMGGGAVGRGQSMGSIIRKAIPERPSTFDEMVAALRSAQSKSSRSHKRAGRVILNFSLISEDCCEQLVKEGGIKSIITLFHSKSPETRECALRALTEISKVRICQEQLLDLDTIMVIIDALNSKQTEFRGLAFSCIDSLSHLDRAKFKLVQEGAVPGCVQITIIFLRRPSIFLLIFVFHITGF